MAASAHANINSNLAHLQNSPQVDFVFIFVSDILIFCLRFKTSMWMHNKDLLIRQ